ncbi:MAG: hypothetical protein ABW173_08730 [Sphingomonas sp.]
MRRTKLTIVLGGALMMAACGKLTGGAEPTGQVAATVNGYEITVRELDAEMAGVPKPADRKAQQALRDAALRSIVNRRLLVDAAKAQKVDATPQFAIEKAKAEDLALITAYQRQLASEVPAPAKDEVQGFVNRYPNSFSDRKVFVVDQIVTANVPDAVLRTMQPLKTLPEIAALLSRSGVSFQRTTASIDGAATDPELVQRIASLPSGEVFVMRNGEGALINQVREVRADPLSPAAATEAALAQLRQRRTSEIITRKIASIISAGDKAVQYNTAYKPAPAPPPARPAPGAARSG